MNRDVSWADTLHAVVAARSIESVPMNYDEHDAHCDTLSKVFHRHAAEDAPAHWSPGGQPVCKHCFTSAGERVPWPCPDAETVIDALRRVGVL